MGLLASDTSALVLEDARVGADAVLGEIGKGFGIALAGLDGGRIGIAAQSIGISRAVIERAIAYGRERRQFGKPIVEFDAIRFSLATCAHRSRRGASAQPASRVAPGLGSRRSRAKRRWPSCSRARPRSA